MIRELGEMLKRIIGYGGEIVFDPGKPDGTMRKLLHVTRISTTGWKPQTGPEIGLRQAYSASLLAAHVTRNMREPVFGSSNEI
jgi:nucleoside-diphosphate-sugar epimerase